MSEKYPIAMVDHCRSAIVDKSYVTFDELTKTTYAQPEIGTKDGYGLVFADIDEGPRTAARVRSISFLGLDVEADAEAVKDDKGEALRDQHGDIIKRVIGLDPPSVDDMIAELTLLGWRCLLHTTYSHGGSILPEGVEHPRYRLIFDLSRPLQPAELKIFGLYVADLLGLGDCFDSPCLDASRLFYTPRCPTEARMKLYRCEVSEGAPLDVDALLTEAQQFEAAMKSTKERRNPTASTSVIDAYNAQAECSEILEEHSNNNLPADYFPNPEPFIKDTLPTPWPAACMPPGMSDAVEAIAEHVQAPQALAGMAVLGAVAHIAMRLVDAQHPKKGALPASLYILTALESGGRKSECFNTATLPVAKLERTAREAHKAQVIQAKTNNLVSNLQAPPDPRTIFVDTTTQKIESEFVNNSSPALSLATDEGGTLLGGHSLKSETRAASLSTLTKLFDGSGVQRDRIGEGQSGFRYGVRFGLYLSAQPIVLTDALSDPLLRGQGFLPRFLYTAPASLAGSRLQDEISLQRKTADDPRIIAYWSTLDRMCRIAVNVDEHGSLILPMVGMDIDAQKAWLDFYNETERQQGVGGDLATLSAFASRAGELAARVAAVYAAWRCCENDTEMSDAIVTGDDMQLAVALVGFSLSEWLCQSDSSTLTTKERDARDLLEWLHRKGWITATRGKIGQNCPNVLRKDTFRRNEALLELQRRRWLIEDEKGYVVIQETVAPPAVAVSAVSAVGQQLSETAETAEKATALYTAGIDENETANIPNDFVGTEA
jgi:hypothetical protein